MTHMDVLVEAGDGRLHLLHGHQHVLDHVMLLVQAADGQRTLVT